MQEDIQEEVVHCPNCKEEVPKTLYCLNCGHPLYKETSLMEEAPKQKAEPELEVHLKPTETHLEPEAEAEVFEPFIEEPKEEAKVDNIILQEPPTELNQMDLPEPSEKEDEVQAPPAEEEFVLEVSLDEDKDLQQEVPVEAVQEEAEVVEEEAESSEAVQSEEESKIIEEKPEEEIVQEPQVVKLETAPKVSEESLWKYDPDPLVQEILQNIAKNISLKVKLSKLMLDGTLKESTFLKLLEKYSAQGERWISRRNEIIERNRYDIDSIEKALEEAKIAMDELEIRKAIGDATDDEYLAKMPAYKWEVNSYAEKIRKSKGEVEYLNNISNVLPNGEMQELKSLIELCCESVYNSGESKVSDTVKSRMKEVLEESLDLVKGSP